MDFFGTFKNFGIFLLFRVLPNGGGGPVFLKLHEVTLRITLFILAASAKMKFC